MPARRKRNLGTGLIVCALLLFTAPDAGAGAAAEPAMPQQAQASAQPAVEEIVVTARKREENLLEIPESLQAFPAEDIERSNISSLSDISLLVPNLYMGRRTDGFPNVSIRGLGAFGNTQGVGFYLDDVQLHGDASARFGDIQRIEVLKGPQGILYGGANIGGAIKFVLNRPDPEEFSGRVRFRGGTDDYADAEVSLNIPLTETWAARLFYYGENDDSFLDNPNSPRLSGAVPNNDDDAGEMHRYGARVSLAGDLTERLSLYASVRYNEEDGPNDVWSRELSGDLRHINNIDTTQNPEHYRETWGWSVELNYDFDEFALTTITSNSDTDSERESDLDITQENILDLFRDHRFDVFTQEVRLTSTGGGPFQWQIGGYYQDYERNLNSDLLVYGGVILNPDLTGDPPAIPTPEFENELLFPIVFERSKRERETWAVFANASYRWNQWELSGGVRVDDWESERANADSGVSGKQDDTENLFRGSISHFFDDDRSMVYALYSQGFEPGDFNLTSFSGVSSLFGYGREKATNYELGYKGRLCEDTVVLTAAVFRLDYKDRQIELQATAPTGEVVEGIVNVGDSRNWGWEADVQWLFHPDWTLSTSVGYLDAEWKSGTRSPITGSSISGRTPLNASDWSGTAALDYDGELGNGMRLFGRLQVRHKGSATTNAQFFDTPGDDFPMWENDRFTVADAHVGIGWENWEVAVSVENIFDEEYYVDVQEFPNFAGPFITPQGAVVIGTFEQSRRIMGWVEYRF